MAFLKGCWTDSNNHAPALLKINTGIARMGYPCTGSWVTYGLGSENRDLPGFVVMYDTKGRGLPKGYATNWSAGFLPGVFQGTGIDTAGTPIPNLARDQALSAAQQRAQLGGRPGETCVRRIGIREIDQRQTGGESLDTTIFLDEASLYTEPTTGRWVWCTRQADHPIMLTKALRRSKKDKLKWYLAVNKLLGLVGVYFTTGTTDMPKQFTVSAYT